MKPEVKSIVTLAPLVVDGTLHTSVRLLEKDPILLGVPGHPALESTPLNSCDTNASKVLTECSLHSSWKIIVGQVDDRPSGIRLLHEHTARKNEGRNHDDREITHVPVVANNPIAISPFSLPISVPPTQDEVEAILTHLNNLLTTLQR